MAGSLALLSDLEDGPPAFAEATVCRSGSWLQRPYLVVLQIAHLVEQNILEPTAAISKESPRPSIDKISQQNTVARFYLRPNQTDRMPGVIGNGKRVARIWREQHLRVFRLLTIR